MYLYRKTDGWFPMWDKDIPRRNVRWDMLMMTDGKEIFKVFQSGGIWWQQLAVGTFSTLTNGIDVDDKGNVFTSGQGKGFAGQSYKLLKHDWETGKVLWFAHTGNAMANCKYYEGYVYACALGDKIYKYGATSGDFIWSATPSCAAVDVDESSGDVYFAGTTLCKRSQTGAFIAENTTQAANADDLKVFNNKVYCVGVRANGGVCRVYNSDCSYIGAIGPNITGDQAYNVDVNEDYIVFGTEKGNVINIHNRSDYSIHKTFSCASGSKTEKFPFVSFNRFNELFVKYQPASGVIQIEKYSATFSFIQSFTFSADLSTDDNQFIARYTY